MPAAPTRPRTATTPAGPRPGRPQTASVRRRHLRRQFDAGAGAEARRYRGEARRRLRGALRERFLAAQLVRPVRLVVEVGGGPGRFTPTLLGAASERYVAVDLAREGLRRARRASRGAPGAERAAWVQAAAEHLPLATGRADAAVLLGNIVSMASTDGPTLLREVARVLRPGGRIIVDFASVPSAIQEFLTLGAERGFLLRVLRDPRYYLLDEVIATGRQPYDPRRLARWEFRFYAYAEAAALLRRTGFRVVDAMAIAPLSAHHAGIARRAARERPTWATLLRLEEAIGRRPGVLDTGHGFVVAAVRTGRAPRRASRRRARLTATAADRR